jgi:outer membrane biosynthesis protein TonB
MLQRFGGWRPFAAIGIGIGLHLGLVLMAKLIPPPPPPQPERRELPVVMAAPPPPPTPPAPVVPPPPKHVEARRSRPAQRPAAAQAAKVVTVARDPNQPLDFTGFDMVTGDSTSYAGGFTASKGKSAKAVSEPTASAAAPVREVKGPSQAKPAGPAREDWACTWPEEAQESDLRDARVSVRVDVDRDGAPESVQILASPAPSFAEAARQCAMAEEYRAALDDDGHHIRGSTPLFVVHFVR